MILTNSSKSIVPEPSRSIYGGKGNQKDVSSKIKLTHDWHFMEVDRAGGIFVSGKGCWGRRWEGLKVISEGYWGKKLDRDTKFIWPFRHTLSNQSSPISLTMSRDVGPLPHVEHELCVLHNLSELFELQLQSVGQSVSRSVGQSVSHFGKKILMRLGRILWQPV